MTPATYIIPGITRGDTWSGFGPIQILIDQGDAFSGVANATTNVITAAAHGLSNGAIVRIIATAGGLTAGRRYYVVSSTTNTFQLSLTSGGSAVDLTTNATHSIKHVAPPASTLTHVRIQFRRGSETGPVGLEMTDEDATDPITIDDATNWIITVPGVTPPSTAGTYYYDIETEDDDEVIKTYVGGTWEIGQDVTRISA